MSRSAGVAGVIGRPIAHSLSPAIHNAAFQELGLDWTYDAFDVGADEVPTFLARAAAEGFVGLSVTMPDKAAAAVAVDELTPEADALGAVNAVMFDAGRTIGANTDGDGFIDALRVDAPDVDLARTPTVILGAGGAARAVIVALAHAGATDVAVVNRTDSRAREVVALAPDVARVGGADSCADAGLIINATSVGMGADGQLPLDPEMLRVDQVVVDLVYWPFTTPLLAAAARRGARTVNGLGMLVHQAARSLTLWSGQEAPIEVMSAAATAALIERA